MTEAPAEDDERPAPAASPPTRSERALADYRRRMRRARVVYYSIVGLVVAACVAGVLVAYSRGEAAHAHLSTFAPPPPAVTLDSPSPSPAVAWRTSDRLAIGTPQAGGTIVTFSKHTVGGRDARTGARTWSYTRTDRTLCTAAQATNTTIAVYELHGNCDEVSAFDSDTGRRRWTRTLDKDAQPVDGHPAFQIIAYTFMVTSSTAIYAIDPVTGLDRWTYYRYGCAIAGAVIGSSGALISQTCARTVRCKDVKFCARGPQLVFRDGSAGNGDDSDHNRDKIIWLRRGDSFQPVTADAVISALQPGGDSLRLFGNKNSSVQETVDLAGGSGAGSGARAVGVASLGTTQVLWRGGTVYAVESTSAKPVWSAAASTPPTAVSPTGNGAALTPDAARITAVAGGDVVTIDARDGAVTARFPLSVPRDAVAYPLGTGFLVGGPTGTVAYR